VPTGEPDLPEHSSLNDPTRDLIDAVQRLSLARTVGEVQEIVRTTARGLRGADGATPEEGELLQALADANAVAMENVALWSDEERRVAERTAALDAALQVNERLLSTLAHELRNTVGGCHGLLELVLDNASYELPDQVRRDLRVAYRSASDALQIVDQQLNLAKIRAGQLSPRVSEFRVDEMLDELAVTYRALRRNEAVSLVVDSPQPGFTVRSDRHLLVQALRNLISNALKFTDAGEVRISVALLPGSGEVTFCVADTGLGIAGSDQDRIFEEFAQVDGAQGGRPHGTGLGLPFVRRVTELLGGRLELVSSLGKGSTFSVIVPADLVPPVA
jgi:signal transduction histidine kinase